MNSVTRRTFLKRAGLGAAAIGVATTVPSFLRNGVKSTAARPAVPAVPMGRASRTGPVIARISDASTGEITLMFDAKEVKYRNPAVVQELFRAAQ